MQISTFFTGPKEECMLLSLHVKNLALIEEEEVTFTDGLNILTGETGAGKSIIIGSINLALGARADKETTDQIKQLLTEDPKVHGAYDLILHNYGPDKNLASVHLELPDTMTVREVDRLSRKLEKRVYKETGVILTGVGVYSYNTGDNEAARIQNHIQEMVLAHDWAVQMHGFYVDVETKELTFDVVLSFEISQKEALAILYEETRQAYPGYKIMIAPDVDISVTD